MHRDDVAHRQEETPLCQRILWRGVGLAVFSCFLAVLVLDSGVRVHAQDPPKLKNKKEKEKVESLSVTGELTAKDATSTLRKGCFQKVHMFKMTPGRSYLIEMIDGGRRIDPYVIVEDSTGAIVAQDDDSGGNNNARLIFTPLKEGFYGIVATTFSSGAVGPYQLKATPMAPGTILPGFGSGPFVHVPAEYGDVVVTVLQPFGMGASGSNNELYHGYVEHRFLVENYSETQNHRVDITIPRTRISNRYGYTLRSITNYVDVAPQSSAVLSIFQPDIAFNYANDAEVILDGKTQDRPLSIQFLNNRGVRSGAHGYSSGPRPQFETLLVSSDLYASVSNNIRLMAVGKPQSPPSGGGISTTTSSYHKPGSKYHNQPYTYYGAHRLQTMSEGINNWSRNWLGYGSFDAVVVPGRLVGAAPKEVQSALWEYVESGGGLLVVGECSLPASWPQARTQLKGFDVLYPGFGQCIIARNADVLSWEPDDWRLITGMCDSGIKAWNQIQSPTQANRSFEIVESVGIPVRGLFIVMVIFVLLIGPFNVYWLARTKRKLWLLWTVPILSAVTCLLLFAYMVAREGWHGHARLAGITILDEGAQRAATVGWLGYYCPTTPGGGLRFSRDTELTPHLTLDTFTAYRNTRSLTIDQSDGQHLDSGWISAKVPIHFLVRRVEKRLERVSAVKKAEGTVAVTNGLKSNIAALWLTDQDGRVYQGGPMTAGAEGTLQPAKIKADGKAQTLRDAFGSSWLEVMRRMETTPGEFLRPGCYLAILEDAPFLEQGLEHTQSRRARSIVFGIMKEPL
ncbi:MAG: hypothetical protein L0Y72_18685 [Gemmataceae bacterium]|nr:hypothetical protein [Gemmataceae bacterium]MCI0642234.1 hypothetical protein [Gemmataceae bacterium]MCI0741075.1 hypothetical protein [Gemmataceae bacterium]